MNRGDRPATFGDPFRPLFAYGTLRDPAVLAAVTGADQATARRRPARTRGVRHRVQAPYPAVSFAGGTDEVDGELIWLEHGSFQRSLHRIDCYEGVPHLLRRVLIEVRPDGDGPVGAYAYEWVGGAHPARLARVDPTHPAAGTGA